MLGRALEQLNGAVPTSSRVLPCSVIKNPQRAGGIGPCQESTIKNQWLAGHKRCALRTHPQDGLRDLHRFSKTADGMEPDRVFLGLRSAKNSLTHRCFDHCGAGSVYTNAMARIFACG